MKFTTPIPDFVPPELADRIDALASPRPFWVNPRDPEALERWEYAARLASALAILHGPDDDRELSSWAWFAARSLYRDPTLTL